MSRLVLVSNDLQKSKQAFHDLQEELQSALSDFSYTMHHIGSTAVLGAITKPVLDVLLVGEDTATQHAVAQLLPELRFKQGELDRVQTKLFFSREEDMACFLVSTHVHVVAKNSPNERDMIALKLTRYLQQNPDDVKAYNDYKKMLAEKYNYDRARYVVEKEVFMKQLRERMEAG